MDRRVQIVIDAQNKAKAALKDAGLDFQKFVNLTKFQGIKTKPLQAAFANAVKDPSISLKQALSDQLINFAKLKKAMNAAGMDWSTFNKIFMASTRQKFPTFDLVKKDIAGAKQSALDFFNQLRTIGGTVFGGLIRNLQNMFAFLRTAFVQVILLTVAIQGIRFVIASAEDIERQRSQIRALTKDVQLTGQIIRWVRYEAKKTPFEVPDLIQMAEQLTAVRLNFVKWFEDIGDLALQGGRSIQEGMEMAIHAITMLKTGQTGEALRVLREMKISIEDFKREGIQFERSGELVSPVSAALDALQRIIRKKFGGSMREMGQDATVIFSNIQDTIRDIALEIAGIDEGGKVIKGGLFDKIKTEAQNFLDWVERNKGVIADWAFKTGVKLVEGINTVLRFIPTLKMWGGIIWETMRTASEAMLLFATSMLGISPSVNNVTDAITKMLLLILNLSNYLKDNSTTIANWIKGIAFVYTISKAIGLVTTFTKVIMELAQAFKALSIASLVASAIETIAAGGGTPVAIAAGALLLAGGLASIAYWWNVIGNIMDGVDEKLKEYNKDLNDTETKTKKVYRGTPYYTDLPGTKALSDAIDKKNKAFSEIPDFTRFEKSVERLITPFLELKKAQIDFLESSDAPLTELINQYKGLAQGAKVAEKEIELLAATFGGFETPADLARLEKMLTEMRTESAKATQKVRELINTLAQLRIDQVSSLVDVMKELGNSSGQRNLIVEQIRRTQDAIHTLDLEIALVKEGSAAWYEYGAKKNQRIAESIRLFKELYSIEADEVDSAISASKAYLDYVKELSSSQGAIRSASNGLISLEMKKLDILNQQLAVAEKMQDVKWANQIKTDIYGVRTEILKMQKDLRKNMEEEFDKMAQKIINAPQSLQLTLGRTGLTSWKNRLQFEQGRESLGFGMPTLSVGAGNTPKVDVKVQIDGEELKSKMEVYIDNRLVQFGSK